MTKRDKPFKNISFQLNSVWGKPTEGTRGISVKGAARARRAGVTMDHHLTPMAQDLAAEMEAERIAKKKAEDPRSDFEKKYDIRDRKAHMTPELFREILINDSAFRRIQRYVDTIMIDDGHGLSATFEFKSSFDDEEGSPVRNCDTIFQAGLAYTLSVSDQPRVILRRNFKPIGILKRLEVPSDLILHSKMMLEDPNSPQHAISHFNSGVDHIFNTGNLRMLFSNVSDLDRILEGSQSKEVPITVSAYRSSKDGPLEIGTLSKPPEESVLHLDFNLISCAALMKRDTIYYPHRSEDELMNEFFDGKAGFIITFKNRYYGILMRSLSSSP